MKNKQTAVEWFNQQLVDRQCGNGDSRSWDEILDQAIEMEKEQIEKAFQHSIVAIVVGKILSPEEYYNETYNKKDHA